MSSINKSFNIFSLISLCLFNVQNFVLINGNIAGASICDAYNAAGQVTGPHTFQSAAKVTIIASATQYSPG